MMSPGASSSSTTPQAALPALGEDPSDPIAEFASQGSASAFQEDDQRSFQQMPPAAQSQLQMQQQHQLGQMQQQIHGMVPQMYREHQQRMHNLMEQQQQHMWAQRPPPPRPGQQGVDWRSLDQNRTGDRFRPYHGVPTSRLNAAGDWGLFSGTSIRRGRGAHHY